MKLNKKIQYGLLFGLYLSRAGRVKVSIAAEQLGLSKSLLEQVAVALRRQGVFNSIRGPGGGYELNGDPSIKDFFDVLSPVRLIKDRNNFIKTQEHRALAKFYIYIERGINSDLYSRSIRTWMQALIDSEVATLKSLDIKGVMNQ